MLELMLLLVIGAAFLVLGWQIWIKQNIGLIHDYHHTHVKEKDKAAYTALMGKGVMLIGVGIVLTGIINAATQSAAGWAAYGLCMIAALALMIAAGVKYNR